MQKSCVRRIRYVTTNDSLHNRKVKSPRVTVRVDYVKGFIGFILN